MNTLRTERARVEHAPIPNYHPRQSGCQHGCRSIDSYQAVIAMLQLPVLVGTMPVSGPGPV